MHYLIASLIAALEAAEKAGEQTIHLSSPKIAGQLAALLRGAFDAPSERQTAATLHVRPEGPWRLPAPPAADPEPSQRERDLDAWGDSFDRDRHE